MARRELSTPTRAFVLGLADERGHLDAEPLYRAAAAAGFSETKIRLTLRRLAEAGLVEQTGRGRRATLQLTEAGLAERSPDLAWVAAAYRVDAGLDAWDGHWHLAAFEIPESKRAARDAVRDEIVGLFGAPLTNGLYVATWAWEPWLRRTAREHGVHDRLILSSASSLRVGESTDPSDVARRLWPVDDLARDYERFVAQWAPIVGDVPADTAEATRVAFEASDAIEAIMAKDPLLPRETLPAGFAGPAARQTYRQLVAELTVHEFLAETNLFGAYLRAIDRALTQTADRFWAETFEATG